MGASHMIRTSLHRGVGFVLFVSLALSAVAGHDGFSLKRKPKVGDTEELTLTGTLDVGGGDAKLTGKETVKVTDVKPDGGYTESTDSHDTSVNMAGSDNAVPDKTETVTYGPDGSVMKIMDGDSEATDGGYRITNLTFFKAPDKPVAVGDDIKYTIPADKTKMTPGVSYDYKVVAAEKIKDWDTLKMTYTTAETDGDSKASTSGTVWVSTLDGSMVKSISKWTNVQMPGVPVPINGEFTIERTK